MGKKTFKRKINPNPQQAQLYDKITFIQTKIIQKINKLKKTKPNFNLCDHLYNNKIESNQQYDSKKNYYDKYWKQYLMTVSLLKKVNEFQQQVNKIQHSVEQIEKKFIQRQTLLNQPALSIIKKYSHKNNHYKIEPIEKQEPNHIPFYNPTVQLKKQQEVQPQFINYHHPSFDNQIFYE